MIAGAAVLFVFFFSLIFSMIRRKQQEEAIHRKLPTRIYWEYPYNITGTTAELQKGHGYVDRDQ